MWEMEAGGWQSDERRERLGNKGEGGGGVAGEEEKEGGEGVGCQERRKQDTNKYPKRETRQ